MPHSVDLQESAPQQKLPTGGVTAEQVSDLYIGTHHRIRRVVDEAMSRGGLSLTRGKALRHLRDRGPVNQRELAELFGYAPRSITDLIDGLERDGLAKRKDDPTDRRAKLVEITPAGRDAASTAMTIHGHLVEQIFGALPPADRADLVRLLELLRNATDAAADAAVPTSSR